MLNFLFYFILQQAVSSVVVLFLLLLQLFFDVDVDCIFYVANANNTCAAIVIIWCSYSCYAVPWSSIDTAYPNQSSSSSLATSPFNNWPSLSHVSLVGFNLYTWLAPGRSWYSAEAPTTTIAPDDDIDTDDPDWCRIRCCWFRSCWYGGCCWFLSCWCSRFRSCW